MMCTERSGRSRDHLGAGDFGEADTVSSANTGRPDFDCCFLANFPE
jgi:hypothetical protein